MHNWGWGMSRFFGGGFIMMGLFWIIAILVIFYLMRGSNGCGPFKRGGRGYQREKPLEILKERWAKGELTKEEYLEIKEELERE